MPKKKRKLSQRQQSEQFINKAREIGVDESVEPFKSAFDAITKSSRPNKIRQPRKNGGGQQ